MQIPGVSQDSAASGELHVRNEHANIQYRINGIMLPDGVGAFGQILDTGIVGSLALMTGALPAQYGLRTAGVLDIQTKTDAFNNSGSVSVYGGSHGTITTELRIWRHGRTDPVFRVRPLFRQQSRNRKSDTARIEAIHDRTAQEKGFLYLSTVIDPTSRLTFMSGVSNGTYQIPNNPGQTPNFTAFGVSNFDSALLNEHQNEFNQFNVLAYQKSIDDIDFQISYFNRYSQLHFLPDPVGDLVFNGVASDVYRQSVVNGIQEDTACRVGYCPYPAVRIFRQRRALAGQQHVHRSCRSIANGPTAARSMRHSPYSIQAAKTGWLFGTYLQDEWKITNQSDPERRLAVRPDVSICRCQPAQPARQPDLEAV